MDRHAAHHSMFRCCIRPLLRPVRGTLRQQPRDVPHRSICRKPHQALRAAFCHDDSSSSVARQERKHVRFILPQENRTPHCAPCLLVHSVAVGHILLFRICQPHHPQSATLGSRLHNRQPCRDPHLSSISISTLHRYGTCTCL